VGFGARIGELGPLVACPIVPADLKATKNHVELFVDTNRPLKAVLVRAYAREAGGPLLGQFNVPAADLKNPGLHRFGIDLEGPLGMRAFAPGSTLSRIVFLFYVDAADDHWERELDCSITRDP
jgi:hypothetical protein